jgi:glutamate formiminotransferase / 5-formyltetrahydrofolate cyclo-ligase
VGEGEGGGEGFTPRQRSVAALVAASVAYTAAQMLIECIPNMSEGRRPEVVAELAEAVTRTSGVMLLDRTSDVSHNRSVFTMAGDAAGLRGAMVSLFEAAVRLIDMRLHTGVHPRIGAIDVVPFVPLEGATMAACVALVEEVAAEVGARLGVPVYLYEEAARQPERRRLEQIRRGQFEGLAAKMRDPAWRPDFGPAEPHPSAGASVIGARMPLIAYNINLTSDNLDAARAIAVAIRESGGGLRCVKAMGVRLAERGIAQVSMNLTNYTATSLRTVFDAVCEQAARHGVEVLESELIGLVPAAALADTSPEYLRFVGFRKDRILEERIRGLED